MSGPEYHVTIKELAKELRPRERLREVGARALSSVELLAIILRTGLEGETVLELANRLLAEPRGLRRLAEASFDELCTIRGIGAAKAAQIMAAVELGKRLAALSPETRKKIRSPYDASSLVMEEMCYLDREEFRIMILNTKNHLMTVETISVGTLNASLVHPREVFKAALRKSAAGVILVHNHPSGDPEPSQEDLEITKRLTEAGRLIGIKVLDHIIIGDHVYLSMKERNLMG